jgi:AAA domain
MPTPEPAGAKPAPAAPEPREGRESREGPGAAAGQAGGEDSGKEEGDGRWNLNEEQTRALGLVRRYKNVFVTGAGGTGKSLLISAVKAWAQSRRLVFAVTATTGVAALNVGGVTIHSWAGIRTGAESVAQLVARIRGRRAPFSRRQPLASAAGPRALARSGPGPAPPKEGRTGGTGGAAAVAGGAVDAGADELQSALDRWTKTQLLIVDEVSMLSSELFAKLDQIGRILRHRPKAPWGGLHLLLTGDFLQLPPVDRPPVTTAVPAGTARKRKRGSSDDGSDSDADADASADLDPSGGLARTQCDVKARAPGATPAALAPTAEELERRYLFLSPAWDAAVESIVLLTRVYRQTDRAFVELLARARMSELTAEDMRLLYSRCLADPEQRVLDRNGIEAPMLHAFRRSVDVENHARLRELPRAVWGRAARHVSYHWRAQPQGLTADRREGTTMRSRPVSRRDPTPVQAAAVRLGDNMMAPDTLLLRVGAVVMLLVNLDVKHRLVNGARGVVVALCLPPAAPAAGAAEAPPALPPAPPAGAGEPAPVWEDGDGAADKSEEMHELAGEIVWVRFERPPPGAAHTGATTGAAHTAATTGAAHTGDHKAERRQANGAAPNTGDASPSWRAEGAANPRAGEGGARGPQFGVVRLPEDGPLAEFAARTGAIPIGRYAWKHCMRDGERHLPDNEWSEFVQITQYPLMLAYACTIHKTQSLTLTAAILDLYHGVQEAGQAYTALSRVQDLSGIFFKRVSPRAFVADPVIKRFYAELGSLSATSTLST